MPKCNTPESAAKYHAYRLQRTEQKQREREERKQANPLFCKGCGKRIDYLQLPTMWRAVVVNYGTYVHHSCPEYRRLKAEGLRQTPQDNLA